jgi:predicted RNA-binding Zn-ribbon protein involved in translation (DUF1610 family)
VTVSELLAGRPSRGELKRRAALLDVDGDLRKAVLAHARRRGVDLPDEAVDWPGKRVLRAALDRTEAAQRRRNPIRRNEPFTCGSCGADVPAGLGADRNHCPRCLRSLHVDVVPGDRAERCGGLMDAAGLFRRGGVEVLRHRCGRCGAERVVRVAEDDDRDALLALARAAS